MVNYSLVVTIFTIWLIFHFGMVDTRKTLLFCYLQHTGFTLTDSSKLHGFVFSFLLLLALPLLVCYH